LVAGLAGTNGGSCDVLPVNKMGWQVISCYQYSESGRTVSPIRGIICAVAVERQSEYLWGSDKGPMMLKTERVLLRGMSNPTIKKKK
jgi:hypothetical protein